MNGFRTLTLLLIMTPIMAGQCSLPDTKNVAASNEACAVLNKTLWKRGYFKLTPEALKLIDKDTKTDLASIKIFYKEANCKSKRQ